MQDFCSFQGKKVLLCVLSLIQLFLLKKSLNLLEPQFFNNFKEPSPSPPRGLQRVLTAKTLVGQSFSPSELVLLFA